MKPRPRQPDMGFWWSCPKCGDVNASPADKRPDNVVGCRCGWEGPWSAAKAEGGAR